MARIVTCIFYGPLDFVIRLKERKDEPETVSHTLHPNFRCVDICLPMAEEDMRNVIVSLRGM